MEQSGSDTELIQTAIDAFRRATRIGVKLHHRTAHHHGDHEAVKLEFVFREGERRLLAAVKHRLNPQNLGLAIDQLTRLPEKAVLITDYVNAAMAERLRQMDILFLDAAGNAYINSPPVLIFIKGEKPPHPVAGVRSTRAFVPAGLKVIYALLCRPELIDAPFRDVAPTAQVALGTVAWVFKDLEQLGHLVITGKRGRKLVRKRQLLERWVAAFPHQLRPKLFLGSFSSADPNGWKHLKIGDIHAQWGGESAAARLVDHVKPEVITLYFCESPEGFIAANQLRRDPKGNIEILQAFWDKSCDGSNPEIVHPILAYADLLVAGDSHHLQAARRIYDEHVAPLWRED